MKRIASSKSKPRPSMTAIATGSCPDMAPERVGSTDEARLC